MGLFNRLFGKTFFEGQGATPEEAIADMNARAEAEGYERYTRDFTVWCPKCQKWFVSYNQCSHTEKGELENVSVQSSRIE